jgi:hypothetical protein
MPKSSPPTSYDSLVQISDYNLVAKLGDLVRLGNWFAFLKPEWLASSGLDKLMATTGLVQQQLAPKPAIIFRGQEMALPGATVAAKSLPTARLLSLTADKALYRANQDTVRLLVAAPLQANDNLKLSLKLNGNPYGEYPVQLDEAGLALWSMQGLPEGAYEAQLTDGDVCRFEVAEYRLALLNAELVEQDLSGEVLRYTLSITTLGQSYKGAVEIELQERGQRVGVRSKKNCDERGRCQGVCKLTGKGPYTLNVYAGERTATVALKGSEQERRETLTISELGEIHEISLLPLPGSAECRGIYIAPDGRNNEPFLVRRVVGREVEITARVAVEMLRVVIVDPVHGTHTEHLSEQLSANQSLSLPIPAPYGLVLLGAFINGATWEGWCAVLCPPELQLACEAPKEARPGSRITVQVKTGAPGRTIPVQLIVKDQRLIAPSDPQVELAACMKKNLATWNQQAYTGTVERKLADTGHVYPPLPPQSMMFPTAMAPISSTSAPKGGFPIPRALSRLASPSAVPFQPMPSAPMQAMSESARPAVATALATMATLTKVRMQFPEVIYNNILKVEDETSVEIKLGDSMTHYTIEAFALDTATLDWQRAETAIETVQLVYGELTVSPFVFPGDPVMGRLDVGATSNSVLVEVRHDEQPLPLFTENGDPVQSGQPIPSGSVLRFPVKPGMITAIVRDASSGEADVSERYITEPGKLRHIMRRLRLLTPGEEINIQEASVLEIKPMPGLEQPFQFLVEGAAKYPFGCIEQTSCKLLAMFAGYMTNQNQPDLAREYEAVIPIWYKRLKSMYLPQSGFCMYPPEEGGNRKPDTYYAPKAIKHLLKLPDAQHSGILSLTLREQLDDIAAMVKDAAAYYKIETVPHEVKSCHDAHQVLTHSDSQPTKSQALAFVRSQLVTRDGQTLVEDSANSNLWGEAVARREETAYAAATLLLGREQADLSNAIAATNYLTAQLNEQGRLYSTVDTEACLVLMLALREAKVVTTAASGHMALNGQEMPLADALDFSKKITTLRSLEEGVIAVQVTSLVIEDWSTFKNEIPVEVRLEQNGRVQSRYHAGDALDLVIRVPRYEPGLLAHICLPDALARVVGGGQVKRFSLDFCEQNELRIPLAVVGSTSLPSGSNTGALQRWLGLASKKEQERQVQHWAVIVRNMFKEEQVGNPGLLVVHIDS